MYIPTGKDQTESVAFSLSCGELGLGLRGEQKNIGDRWLREALSV